MAQSYNGFFILSSKKGSIRVPTVILTILFISFRLGTSEVNSAAFPIIGLLLIVLLLYSNPVWGFVLTLYDMCLLAEQVGVQSWQFYDLFRFKDLEFLVLLAAGIQMGALSFKGKYSAKLTKPILFYLMLIGAMTIFSGISYGFADALRVSRMLFFVSLIFVLPGFCKDLDDLKRLLKYVYIFVSISTLINFAGFVIGEPEIMTPFNHNLDEAGRVWIGSGGVERIYSGIGYAGYAAPFSYLTIFCLVAIMIMGRLKQFSWIVILGLAVILEVLTVSRSAISGLIVGLGTIILLGRRRWSRKDLHLGIALCSWVLALLIVSVTLFKDSSVLSIYSVRFADLLADVRGVGEGSVVSRFNYFQTAINVMDDSGGNVLTGMGYRLLPTELGVLFRIGPFSLSQFQESGQLIGTTSMDSGWANVFWSLGVTGVIFFVWFIAYYLRLSFSMFRPTSDVVARSLSLSLFAFFVVYPLLFFAMHMIYGKSVQLIIQFVLLVGTLGLWLDYSVGKAGQRTTGAIGL